MTSIDAIHPAEIIRSNLSRHSGDEVRLKRGAEDYRLTEIDLRIHVDSIGESTQVTERACLSQGSQGAGYLIVEVADLVSPRQQHLTI